MEILPLSGRSVSEGEEALQGVGARTAMAPLLR